MIMMTKLVASALELGMNHETVTTLFCSELVLHYSLMITLSTTFTSTLNQSKLYAGQ